MNPAMAIPRTKVLVKNTLTGSRFTQKCLAKAPVAQLDRVVDFESSGRRFESCPERYFIDPFLKIF